MKALGTPTRKAYGKKGVNLEEYVSFKERGLSLLFKEGKLDAIFLYNDGTEGFSGYKGTLPLGLDMNMKNVQVVKLLGEPSKKSPYNNVSPLWIEYSSKGLLINFKYKSYDDLDNPITCVSLFSPE